MPGMGRRRGVLLLALVLVLAMVPLSHANACSCIANTDPRDRLAAAEGAFIGELVGRRETGLLGSIISSGRDVVYTFEVAEVFKGDLGQRVDVHSAAGGGSCGFEVAPGEAVGVLLYRHQGTWQSGLCGQIEPDKLRAAAAPLPAPDGQAPAALVVGGSFGEARLLALDRHARTLARGFGAGRTTHLSICPGGNRLLEAVHDDARSPRLALRELPGLGLVWERPLPRQPASIYTEAPKCLDGGGTGYVFFSNGGDPRWSPKATLLRVSRTTTTVLYQGAARSIAFGSDVAYVNEGHWGEDIGRINLQSGQVTPMITGPRYMTRVVLRPDGSALATQAWGEDFTRTPGDDNRGSRPPQVVIIDLKPSPPRARTTILSRANRTETGRSVWGNMVWLNANRIGFFPAAGAHPRARIFDNSLRELGGFDNWAASTSLLMGEAIVGLGEGRPTVADLPNGPTRVVEQFESRQMFALAALPGATEVSPRPQAARAPAPPGATPVPQAAPPVSPGAPMSPSSRSPPAPSQWCCSRVSFSSAVRGEESPMPRTRVDRR
jgi:hypothetical protein